MANTTTSNGEKAQDRLPPPCPSPAYNAGLGLNRQFYTGGGETFSLVNLFDIKFESFQPPPPALARPYQCTDRPENENKIRNRKFTALNFINKLRNSTVHKFGKLSRIQRKLVQLEHKLGLKGFFLNPQGYF